MTIQTKLIILAIIFTVLLVAIHPVPESAKEKHEREKAQRNDPLMSDIDDYNKNQLHKLRDNKYVPPAGASQKMENYKIGNGDNPYPTINKDGRQNPNQPNFGTIFYSDQDADGDSPAPAAPYTAPAYSQPQYTQPTANQGYYPPPPLPGNNSQQMNLQPRSSNENRLSDGKQVVYAGVYVYKVDSNGNTKPMPDGDYTTEFGVPLHVHDGKKFIVNNN